MIEVTRMESLVLEAVGELRYLSPYLVYGLVYWKKVLPPLAQ